MTIATADGNHIVANAYSNLDLFWALRGGGGGYYSGHLQDAFLHPLLYHIPPRQRHQPHPTRTCSRRSSVSPPRSSNTVTEATAVGCRPAASLHPITQHYAEETQATFIPLFDIALSQEGLQIQNYMVAFEDFWTFYVKSAPRREISSWWLPKESSRRINANN